MSTEYVLTPEDIAISIHTSIRKYCNSEPTSLMYNLIHILTNEDCTDKAWKRLYNLIANNLKDVDMSDQEAVATVVRETWQTHPMYRPREKSVKITSGDLALYLAATIIPENEWMGIVFLIAEN